MITGAELGRIMGHHRYRHHADAARAAQRLGLPAVGSGNRREFTLGQVVAVLAIAGLVGPIRAAIIDQVPDLVDLEHVRWISLVHAPGEPRIGWGSEPEHALDDLGAWHESAELVHLIDVGAEDQAEARHASGRVQTCGSMLQTSNPLLVDSLAHCKVCKP